jgi:hypothetical protein
MRTTTIVSNGWARARRAARADFALAAFLALLAAVACGKRPGHDPKALTVIDRSFQPLRRDFEASRNKVRLVGIVTPTCGQCQDASRAIRERVLPEVTSADFEVFLVWVSHVPPDVEVRARVLAEKFRDPRIRHYWDDSGRIARAFGVQAGLPQGSAIYDVYYLYGRGDTWDPNGEMAREPANRNALLEGWLPSPPQARFGGFTDVRMPAFDAVRVRDRALELLGPVRP